MKKSVFLAAGLVGALSAWLLSGYTGSGANQAQLPRTSAVEPADALLRVKVEEAYAALQAARAERERMQVDVANTTLRAPFDGVLHERRVEVGDYVAPGTVVATMLA